MKIITFINIPFIYTYIYVYVCMNRMFINMYVWKIILQGPVKECITEPIDVSKSLYRPLKLKYQAISKESSTYSQLQKQHPISIQIPQLMEKSKIIMPDCNQGKSYKYDVQTPSPSYQSMPHLMSYNFDLQVPSSTTFASPS